MKFRLSAVLAIVLAPFILAGDIKDGHPSDQIVYTHPSRSLEDLSGKLTGSSSDNIGPAVHVGGGEEAPRHGFPHVAVLYMTSWLGDITLCGGSLISPKWILTAAHCVSNAQGVTALLGTHNRRVREYTSRQTIKIAHVFVEKNYTLEGTDIALLMMERSAQLNKYVQPIRLPAWSQKNKDFAGVPAEIIGWGKYTDASNETSPFLRRTSTKIISNKDCEHRYPQKITSWRICSDGSNGKGPCAGDSGGPISITEADGVRTVVGVMSLGNRRCGAGQPAVHTRVDVWLQWINKLTNIPIRA